MLFTLPYGFGLSASNYGATYTEAGLGTDLTAGGSNNTKNASITSILAGSSVPEDVYGVSIGFILGSSSGAARRFMTDIYVDPAGGTAWENDPRIANLSANSPSLTVGGVWYYFPMFVHGGSSFGATCQAEIASSTITILIKVFMKPVNLDMVKVGSKVITYGASTATTVGTTFTPGTGAMGSYSATLGAVQHNIFWWQMGVLVTDTSHTANTGFYEVGVGNTNAKVTVLQDRIRVVVGTAEANGIFNPMGSGIPMYPMGLGNDVFVRGACLGAPDTGHSAVVYGVVT